MSMIDPFADLTRLRQELDRYFGDAQRQNRPQEPSRVWRPQVDAFEDADTITLKIDLPGIDRNSLDVQVTGEELVVTGQRKWEQPEKGSCVHAERPHGQFHRAFRLGIPVQNDAVTANYRDGVLIIQLPKAETVKPRKVAVRSEGEE